MWRVYGDQKMKTFRGVATIALLAACILFGVGNPPMERAPPIPARVWVTAAVLLASIAAMEFVGMWLASFVLMVGLGRSRASPGTPAPRWATW